MIFLVLFGIAILFAAFAYTRTYIRASRLSRLSWEDLLARVEPVSVSGISIVALDYLQPSKGQLQIGTTEIWAMIGMEEGVRKMYANAEILIALAGYAQRWNPEESVIVTERMRRDGITLRRAALKLSIGHIDRRVDVLGPFNVQEAASAYYLMRQRLLALYETSHVGRYARLAEAL